MATITALRRAGWAYDWSLDRMFGRGCGWTSQLAVGVTMAEAVVLTIKAGIAS